jgi:hypothetical protein
VTICPTLEQRTLAQAALCHVSSFMRKLGRTLLVTGFLWACVSIPLYRAYVTGTTSVSLEVLTGRDHLSREEVYSAFFRNDSEMKRYAWRMFLPTLLTFCGGLLLNSSCKRRHRASDEST